MIFNLQNPSTMHYNFATKPILDEGIPCLPDPLECERKICEFPPELRSFLLLHIPDFLENKEDTNDDPVRKQINEIRDQINIVRNENSISLEKEMYKRLLTSEIYNRFYGSVLGSRPDLDPELMSNQSFHMLNLMIQDIHDFLQKRQNEISCSDYESLLKCARKLEKLSEKMNIRFHLEDVDTLIEKTKHLVEDYTEFLNENITAIMKEIETLPIGDYCLLPGGSLKHATLFEIKRLKDAYMFTIINTGDDEPYSQSRHPLEQLFTFHPVTHQLYRDLSQSDRYAHKAYILRADALDEACLRGILSPLATFNFPAPHRIRHLDDLLIQERSALVAYGRLHHPQKRGNCAVKCFSCWLKGSLIEKLEEVKGRALYEQFNVYRTEKMMAIIQQQDQDSSPEKLQYIYRVKTNEEVNKRIQTRDQAAHQVLERRRAKAEKYKKLCQ